MLLGLKNGIFPVGGSVVTVIKITAFTFWCLILQMYLRVNKITYTRGFIVVKDWKLPGIHHQGAG